MAIQFIQFAESDDGRTRTEKLNRLQEVIQGIADTSAQLNETVQFGNVTVQDTLTILDSTGADSAVFQHDGTNLLTTVTNTGNWLIDGLSNAFQIRHTDRRIKLEHVVGSLDWEVDSGGATFDIDAVPLDGTSNAVVRFHRTTNTTGLAQVSFLLGNNSTTAYAIFRSDNTSGARRFILQSACSFENLAGATILDSVISPAQITANTNDYNPTGLATATHLRLSTDASRNLTGIVAQPSGTILYLWNVGTQPLVLVNNATSTAANRFLCPGAVNYTLTTNSAAMLWYDSATSRWRVLGGVA